MKGLPQKFKAFNYFCLHSNLSEIIGFPNDPEHRNYKIVGLDFAELSLRLSCLYSLPTPHHNVKSEDNWTINELQIHYYLLDTLQLPPHLHCIFRKNQTDENWIRKEKDLACMILPGNCNESIDIRKAPVTNIINAKSGTKYNTNVCCLCCVYKNTEGKITDGHQEP